MTCSDLKSEQDLDNRNGGHAPENTKVILAHFGNSGVR